MNSLRKERGWPFLANHEGLSSNYPIAVEFRVICLPIYSGKQCTAGALIIGIHVGYIRVENTKHMT